MGIIQWFKELIWPDVKNMKVRVADITSILNVLDKDQDGFIEVEEVIEAAKGLGVKL